jgi:hypothetical protein
MSYYKQMTASGLVKEGAGKLMGIFVTNAASTPTLKVWDQTSAAVPVLADTWTPVSATDYISFTTAGVHFTRGLFITISGTVACTVVFE